MRHQLFKASLKALEFIDAQQAKRLGFSDNGHCLFATTKPRCSRLRLANGIVPVIKQIDTLAGEFRQTNYLYMTYHGSVDDVTVETPKSQRAKSQGK